MQERAFERYIPINGNGLRAIVQCTCGRYMYIKLVTPFKESWSWTSIRTLWDQIVAQTVRSGLP